MKGDIEKYVKGCALCSLNKHVNHPNKAPMPETSIPDKPLEELMIDFLGPFQRARTHQFRYVLQIQDVLSRFILLIPCQDATAETAASCLVDRWVCLFVGVYVIGSQNREPLQKLIHSYVMKI